MEISGGVSTKYCFKMGRYLEIKHVKVEGRVRKGTVLMMPEECSGGRREKKRVEGEHNAVNNGKIPGEYSE